MNPEKVAVVILNFNNQKFLEKFLPGIISKSMPHRVYLADNGSSDGSPAFVRSEFPQVTVVENGGNYGYAKGYNLALKNINADYFILLNSDVEVTENWIEPVIALMKSDPLIAACQPKVLDHACQDKFEYAGAAGGFIDKYGYPFCRGRIFNVIEKDTEQYEDAREIFWATGACLFVQAKAFWHAGGFDEAYFAHMEEIDLCWRLKNFRYKIFVQPASVVYHVGGGTLSKISARKTYLNFRNNLSTLAKNHPSRMLFLKVAFRMNLDGVAAFKFLFEGAPGHFFAVIRAHATFYRWLPRIIRTRHHLKKQPGFKFSFSQVYKKNIVAEHFLRGKKKFSELQGGFFSEEQ